MPNVSRIYSDYLLLVVKEDYFFEIFETLVGIVQFVDDANRPEILITIPNSLYTNDYGHFGDDSWETTQS